MENTGIKPNVIKQIRCLAKENGIEKVILFGSRARGDYTRTSDIDLAVSGGNADAFHFELENDTDTLLKYDVVKMDCSVRQELLESIKRDGLCIYEKV